MKKLEENEVQLWSADLTKESVASYAPLLSDDEMARAERLRSPIHRERFIIARGILRQLLSHYLGTAPEKIIFAYSAHGKPFIDDETLQFNVAHSHGLALYGFTYQRAIGVDIEKIRDYYTDSVAKRFFSPAEYASIVNAPEVERIRAFYHIWSGKEALVKALGLGLSYSLASFTVPMTAISHLQLENKTWHLEFFPVQIEYISAVAVEDGVQKISHQKFEG